MISNVTNVVRVRFLPTLVVVFTVSIFIYIYSCNWNICFLKNTSLGRKLYQLRAGSYQPDKDLSWIPINSSSIKSESAKRNVNILCFGDSITEGHVASTGYHFVSHPYTLKLEELLNKLGAQSGVKYNVFNRGLSGEHVQGQMTSRLPIFLTGMVKWDWVIILGGTNDIRRSKWFEDYDDELLYKGLVELHTYCHKKGIKTVAVTIPARQCEDKDIQECAKVKTMRLKINRKLKEFVDKMGKKVILADLAAKLPFHLLSDEEREKYWVDEVHFTYEGYDKMGEIIYNALLQNKSIS